MSATKCSLYYLWNNIQYATFLPWYRCILFRSNMLSIVWSIDSSIWYNMPSSTPNSITLAALFMLYTCFLYIRRHQVRSNHWFKYRIKMLEFPYPFYIWLIGTIDDIYFAANNIIVTFIGCCWWFFEWNIGVWLINNLLGNTLHMLSLIHIWRCRRRG